MNFRILEKDKDSMRFVAEGISTPLANTLRRIIVAEVPCMAIDDVVIIENSSVLHDEILALRLGLVPLKTDLDSYNLPEGCTCESELGCHLCRTVLTLDIQADTDGRTVYSRDLMPEDPSIAPVSDSVPIVKLASGQRVRLEAYAKLGNGKDHAKWQPVSACTYRYMPAIEIDKTNCDACGDCVDICPKQVYSKNDNEITVANLIECILCEDCVEACSKNPPAIKVSGDQSSFIFYIESTGVLAAERVVSEAINIYHRKFSEFLNQLAGIENEPKKTD
ncbi:MAG: DNA-directed RNA polymerase subunit D [Candidatus Bathyarchaeota archaeon]|nr:DNA-directed RNA polymerase subunit D [Candidatus Bathyarchaeota archaeon]